MTEYKEVNGTMYNVDTPDEVIQWLETSRERQQRIRIFYGDTDTGKDWCEVFDTIGCIGRSTGKHKIPLLIKSKRSLGGGAILDHCIVRITTKGSNGKIRTVYEHPKYHLYQECMQINDTEYGEIYKYKIVLDGTTISQHREKKDAENYCAFLLGLRNKF